MRMSLCFGLFLAGFPFSFLEAETSAGRPDEPVVPPSLDLPHPESLEGWRPSEILSEVWPFDRPPIETLRGTGHKVFAHYFTPFPLSYDNKPFDQDTYAVNELTPEGEGGKYLKDGGFLRDRPLPVGPWDSPLWLRRNMAVEIVRARELGLDGFTWDILTTSGRLWEAGMRLLDTAQEIDPGFKIVLMPDMNAGFKEHPDRLYDCLLALSKHPSVYRLDGDGGRIVVAPFLAEAQTPAWWNDLFDRLAAQGVKVAFYPLFLGAEHAKDYRPISEGSAFWGPETASQVKPMIAQSVAMRAIFGHFMMPVSAQDVRPRDLWFRETENTGLLRNIWKAAIDAKMDWIQMVTWNDYSESTGMGPSLGTQYLFYDLSAYYLIWHKTGAPPPIVRDALYYCHRSQILPLASPPSPPELPFKSFSGPISNQVELVAFLKEPGILEIELDGKISRKEAPAGLTSFSVPAAPGRPVFRLLRDDKTVIELPSAWSIGTQAAIEDPLYRGGSSNRRPFTTQSPVTAP